MSCSDIECTRSIECLGPGVNINGVPMHCGSCESQEEANARVDGTGAARTGNAVRRCKPSTTAAGGGGGGG